jgi:hypothetical protein
MNQWKVYFLGLAALGVLAAPALHAQPAVPAAPAPPPTLMSFLGLSPDQLAACKDKFCQCCLGQLIANGMKPLNCLSGCLIPPCCPPFSQADLKKGGAEGAAAQIKKDEAECAARRVAVRYLGTVDCHWWPDAEGALIATLRADRCECVRWEAAMALGHGCCCTKKTIEALAITVSRNAKPADGNPSENSARVRQAAEEALNHCLACYSEVVPAPSAPVKPPPTPERTNPPRPEGGPSPEGTRRPVAALEGGDIQCVAYYQHMENRPLADVVTDARRVLAKARDEAGMDSIPTGHRSLMTIVSNATFNGAPPDVTVVADERPMPVGREPKMVEPIPTTTVMPAIAPAAVPSAPVQQHSAVQAGVSAYRTVSWNTPAARPEPRPAYLPTTATPPAVVANVPRLLMILRASAMPAEREKAAVAMTAVDWRVHPEVVQALLTAVCTDPTPSVRARCIGCLARMNAGTPEVKITLGVLQQDSDPEVQQAVRQALVQFKVVQSVHAN